MALSADFKRAMILEFGVGLPINVLFFLGLYFWWLPDYPGLESPVNRLAFTAICCVLPTMTMLFGVWAVAIGRGTSAAMDPLIGAEGPRMKINMRYLQNTLEQLVLFCFSALALSYFLDGDTVKVIPALAILFFVNRLVYWIGYQKHHSLRGIGLSGTLYPITIMCAAAFYFSVRLIVTGTG